MRILNHLRTAGRYALELLAAIFVIAVLAFMALMVFVPDAHAAGTTAQVVWTLPTQRIDNAPLPVTQIRESLVEWRRTASGPVVGSMRVASPGTSVDVPGLVCGDFVFTVKVLDLASLESDPSSPPAAYATGIACRPKSATGVTAT